MFGLFKIKKQENSSNLYLTKAEFEVFKASELEKMYNILKKINQKLYGRKQRDIYEDDELEINGSQRYNSDSLPKDDFMGKIHKRLG